MTNMPSTAWCLEKGVCWMLWSWQRTFWFGVLEVLWNFACSPWTRPVIYIIVGTRNPWKTFKDEVTWKHFLFDVSIGSVLRLVISVLSACFRLTLNFAFLMKQKIWKWPARTALNQKASIYIVEQSFLRSKISVKKFLKFTFSSFN